MHTLSFLQRSMLPKDLATQVMHKQRSTCFAICGRLLYTVR